MVEVPGTSRGPASGITASVEFAASTIAKGVIVYRPKMVALAVPGGPDDANSR